MRRKNKHIRELKTYKSHFILYTLFNQETGGLEDYINNHFNLKQKADYKLVMEGNPVFENRKF
jgi:hypothetical protein